MVHTLDTRFIIRNGIDDCFRYKMKMIEIGISCSNTNPNANHLGSYNTRRLAHWINVDKNNIL